VIDAVRDARATEQRAAIEQLQLAVRWALLHPCTSEHAEHPPPALTVFECGCAMAGPGTPLVDEFAPASLAAALGISRETGARLISQALELLYRLPRLWALALAGRVPVWRARMIAQETTDLGPDGVAFADRLISSVPAKTNLVNATRLVAEARLYFDPDRAIAQKEAELAKRGVWLRHRGNPATTEIVMTLETPRRRALRPEREPPRRRPRDHHRSSDPGGRPGRGPPRPTPSLAASPPGTGDRPIAPGQAGRMPSARARASAGARGRRGRSVAW
jgi:hypothetical protein